MIGTKKEILIKAVIGISGDQQSCPRGLAKGPNPRHVTAKNVINLGQGLQLDVGQGTIIEDLLAVVVLQTGVFLGGEIIGEEAACKVGEGFLLGGNLRGEMVQEEGEIKVALALILRESLVVQVAVVHLAQIHRILPIPNNLLKFRDFCDKKFVCDSWT